MSIPRLPTRSNLYRALGLPERFRFPDPMPQSWFLHPGLPRLLGLPRRQPNLLDLYLERIQPRTKADAQEEMRFEQFVAGR